MKHLSFTIHYDERVALTSDTLKDSLGRKYGFSPLNSSGLSSESEEFYSSWTLVKSETRVVQNDLVKFEIWEGYVSLIAADYFEVVVKNHSSVKRLRINKCRIADGESLFADQLVRVKVKYYIAPSGGNKKSVVELNLGQPIETSSETLEKIVAEKIKRLSYMFEDDDKR